MNKVRRSDLIAPVGGIAMFAASFLTWYSYPDPIVAQLQQRHTVPGQPLPAAQSKIDATVWDLTLLRYVLYFAALSTVVYFFLCLFSRSAGKPAAFLTPVFWLNLVACIAVGYRWINPPFDQASVHEGLIVALGAAVLALAGSLIAMRDERVPAGFEQAPEPLKMSVAADATLGPVPPVGAPPTGVGN